MSKKKKKKKKTEFFFPHRNQGVLIRLKIKKYKYRPQ